MKNKLVKAVADIMLGIGKHYDGNVSPHGYYKPRKKEKSL